jgi:hypothetical protein
MLLSRVILTLCLTLLAGVIGPHWAHLYGWPEEADEEDILIYSKLMKPIEYKGRVLIAFEVEEDKGARVSKKKAVKAEEPEMVEYELRFDLFQIGELPLDSGTVFVSYGAGNPQDEEGEYYRKTAEAELDGNSTDLWLTDRKIGQCRPFRMKWPIVKRSNCYHEKQVPDVFINVMHKGMLGDAQRIG